MANLKKHIKKRFLFEVLIEQDVSTLADAGFETVAYEDAHKLKKIDKGNVCMIHYDNGNTVLAFPFRYEGAIRWVPEPDPVLILFNTAYFNYKQLLSKKSELMKVLTTPRMSEGVINDLYTYFGTVSTFIISLFTSLEAFMNRVIKEDFVYKKVTNKRTELYSKSQLDFLPTDEKITDVLKQATGKDFNKAHPVLYQKIMALKEFRNSIVHLKATSEGHTPYNAIFKKSFQFQYDESLNAVKEFINFYHPLNSSYIEECNCSNPE